MGRVYVGSLISSWGVCRGSRLSSLEQRVGRELAPLSGLKFICRGNTMASASLLGVFEVVVLIRVCVVCVCVRERGGGETSLFSHPNSRIYLYHLFPKSRRKSMSDLEPVCINCLTNY